MKVPAAQTESGPASPWLVGWVAAFTLAAWMAGAIWPRLLVNLGIYDYNTIYLDSYAILAALDAVRAGVDPHGANSLDVLLRPHVYSDWWLSLRWLGLTREHNFLVGTAWAGAFALAVWVTTRPCNLREAFWLTVLLVSAPVLLALNRGKHDLGIF